MNQYQKLFKQHFIELCKHNLTKGNSLELYTRSKFSFADEDVLINKKIPLNSVPELVMPEPEKENFHEYENSVRLFETYKKLDRTQATDTRIWVYMSHVQYWDYMKKRWPFPKDDGDKQITNILDHWFMFGSKSISRHGIASLWWGAFITYDKNRQNPYELTKEFFSKQDYKRVILEENICFYKPLVHAVLEYAVENQSLFEKYWAPKMRFLIRKLNFISTYKILSSLPKPTIKKIIDEYKQDIKAVEPVNILNE